MISYFNFLKKVLETFLFRRMIVNTHWHRFKRTLSIADLSSLHESLDSFQKFNEITHGSFVRRNCTLAGSSSFDPKISCLQRK